MKIVIETNDETLEDLVNSLKVVFDSQLNAVELSQNFDWLESVKVTQTTGPVEILVFSIVNNF